MCSEMGEQRVAWQSRPFWSRKLKKNNKGTGTGRALLGEEQAQESELWSEEYCAWWSKGKRCKKGFSEGNESFRKGGVRTNRPEKGSSSDFNPHKGKGKDQKGKGKGSVYPQSGFSATETLSEEGHSHSRESENWFSSLSDDSSCSSLRGTTAWYGTTLRQTCWKVVIFTVRHHLHVLPELMCLKRATCLSYSPFPQMQNMGITLELEPEGAKITWPVFGLYSSPIEYSTMGHIGLAYQPKSRERLARSTKHVTFAPSQRKSAYRASVQELDDDEGDKPLVRPGRTAVSKDEDADDKFLVQPASKEKNVET